MSYSIQIKYPKPNIPSHYYDNGNLYLDLPIDFDLSLWNAPTKTNLDGFSELAIMQSDLPSTPKNDMIFAIYNDVNIYQPNYKQGIEVLIMNGGIALAQDTLQIEGYSDESKTYSANFEYGKGDIVTKMKDTLLRDLFPDAFVLDRDLITGDFLNLDGYDGRYPYALPLVNYGRFYLDKPTFSGLYVHAVEFRPFLFAAAVFEKAFCGFNLTGGFVGSDFFKKLITYDLRADYDRFLIPKRKFLSSVILDAVIFPTGTPLDVLLLIESPLYRKLDLIVSGALPNTFGLDWNNTDNSFGVNRHGIYSFNFTCIAVPDPNNSPVTISMGIFKNGVVLNSDSTSIPFTRLNVSVDAVELLPSDVIEVRYISNSGTGIDSQYIYDVSFTNEPIRDCTPYEGESVLLKDALDQNLTVYEYIKGVSDAFQLSYVINRATAQIGIYPQGGNIIFSEPYQPLTNTGLTPLDWSEKGALNSLDIRFPTDNKAIKDIEVAWKDATDKFITEITKPNPQLYSYYELVDSRAKDSFSIKNDLFEPTITEKYYFEGNNDQKPNLPILLDNQDNQKSYDLGHRILLLVGNYGQGNALTYISEIYATTTVLTTMSFATMLYEKPLLTPLGATFDFTKNLTYNATPLNIYNQLIKQLAREIIELAEFDKLILLTREDFLNYDFTRLVLIRTNLNNVLCKVKMIKDFSLDKDNYTLVTFTPYIAQC